MQAPCRITAREKIIGTQTFGKGIVQTIKPLTDGSAVKLTTAKYYTPNGQNIHGQGVTPDIAVEQGTDENEDTQWNTAVEYRDGGNAEIDTNFPPV